MRMRSYALCLLHNESHGIVYGVDGGLLALLVLKSIFSGLFMTLCAHKYMPKLM